jgi:hypothetical protein
LPKQLAEGLEPPRRRLQHDRFKFHRAEIAHEIVILAGMQLNHNFPHSSFLSGAAAALKVDRHSGVLDGVR